MAFRPWLRWSLLLLLLAGTGCRTAPPADLANDTPPKQYNPKMATYASGG
jgi:hypothetical protein